jgi:uncharacterized protein (TIGR00730 family)
MKKKLSSVCVYCGSRNGQDAAFVHGAETLGRQLAARKIRLVYGGASIGMMGMLARAVLANGGEVTGVIPDFLTDLEMPLDEVTERVVTDTMHTRKQAMFERSDAFVVMPGGIGTLEEAFEMMTWRQLHRHAKPIIFVNIKGYWDSLIALIDHVIDCGFAGADLADVYHVVNSAEDVIPTIERALATTEAPPEAESHLEEI